MKKVKEFMEQVLVKDAKVEVRSMINSRVICRCRTNVSEMLEHCKDCRVLQYLVVEHQYQEGLLTLLVLDAIESEVEYRYHRIVDNLEYVGGFEMLSKDTMAEYKRLRMYRQLFQLYNNKNR